MRRTFLCAAAAVALLPGTEAWTFLTKRDASWVPSDPLAFEVSLDFDNAGRYLVPVGMGDPWAKAGNFSFLLSTSSPCTAVAAAGCATCVAQVGQAPVYDISKSSSAIRQGINIQGFEIGPGSMSGELIHEACSFKRSKASQWSYDNLTVLMIENTNGVLVEGASGLVGLGRSTGNDSFISGVLNTRGWTNLTFGFAFNAFNAYGSTTQSAGSFNVREVNPSMFAGELSWQPLARISGVPKNIPTDWAISFDSYKITSGSQSTTNSGGVAVIDPYFQELRIPRNEAMEFFGNIIGASMTNDGVSVSWVVPCNQELSLSATIGNSTYRMKKEQIINVDSTGTLCTSLVKGWSDPAVRAYVFGTPFTAIAYIAYNAYRDQSSDQIGLAPRSVEPTDQAGSRTLLIAAITGSILLGVFIVSTILCFFYRRRGSYKRDSNAGVEGKVKVEPFTGGAPKSATLSEGDVSMRYSQFTDFVPPSETTPHLASSWGTPQSSDSRRARSSSHLLSMRQSQVTDVSACTPTSETAPHLEVPRAIRPSPPLNQAFYGPPSSSQPQTSWL